MIKNTSAMQKGSFERVFCQEGRCNPLGQECVQEEFSLAQVALDSYTEIYEFDLLEDTSVLLFSNRQALIPVCGTSPVSNGDIVATHIHPADREAMRTAFSGRVLRDRFLGGEQEITHEFRRMGPGGQERWVAGLAVPLGEAADKTVLRRALLFIKDLSCHRGQEEQRHALEQYGLALRNVYDIFFEMNLTQSSYHIVHKAMHKLVTPFPQGSLQQLLGNDNKKLIFPKDRKDFLSFFNATAIRRDFAKGNSLRTQEVRLLYEDGIFHWTVFTMLPMCSAKGSEERYLVFGLDIHGQKMAEEVAQNSACLQRQRLQDERYRIVVEETSTLIFEWRGESRFLAPEIMERFAGNYDGRDVFAIWRDDRVVHADDMPLLLAFLENKNLNRHEMTIRLMQRSGAYLWCRVSITHVNSGVSPHWLGTLNDVDQMTRAVLSLREKAERDSLTGLYNTRTFYSEAQRKIDNADSKQWHIIRLDIDGFKVINDLYGLDEGDRLLRTLAEAMQKSMGEHCVCARLGGDIFCACVDFDEKEIMRLVRQVSEVVARYPLPSRILPSFGICCVDSPDTPISVFCELANIALKTVKGNTLTFHAFYDDALRQTVLRQKCIESEMGAALEHGELKMYLQPKVHIQTGRIVGAEGLARWEHPERGVIVPDEFMDFFEKSGFIVRLDAFMWEEACKVLSRWQDKNIPLVPLSVNVSRVHIHDMRLCEKLGGLVREHSVPAGMIELELTESVLLDHKAQIFESIVRLRNMGFRFSLDNFGAGHSSLNILKNIQVETLKLDRGFLDEAGDTDRGLTIIQGIIALATSIGMDVVAEGVEKKEQARFLWESGCTVAQGFYYSPPVPVEKFEELLKAQES